MNNLINESFDIVNKTVKEFGKQENTFFNKINLIQGILKKLNLK
jgi:hypothetical protein